MNSSTDRGGFRDLSLIILMVVWHKEQWVYLTKTCLYCLWNLWHEKWILNCKKFWRFICMKGQCYVGDRERESSNCLFSFQIVTIVRICSCWSQKPWVPSGSPLWMAGTHVFEPSLVAFPGKAGSWVRNGLCFEWFDAYPKWWLNSMSYTFAFSC